jgi:hypothetical protein
LAPHGGRIYLEPIRTKDEVWPFFHSRRAWHPSGMLKFEK